VTVARGCAPVALRSRLQRTVSTTLNNPNAKLTEPGELLEAPETASHRAALSRGRRLLRRLGTAAVVLGVLAIAYGGAVYFWHDPVTDLYARWKQHELASELEQTFREFRPVTAEQAPAPTPAPQSRPTELGSAPSAAAPVNIAAERRAVAANARRLIAGLELGDPIGRIVVPELGIRPVVVHGTRYGADLSRGPGHYEQTSLPGLGKVTAIAGHRTTFGAWFRHIDDLERGDAIRLELPYGTFHYRVTSHKIVDNGDWSILRPTGYDRLVLSACHPLYSASERWVVYARLVSVDTPEGVSYAA
jgi:sortase A